MLKDKNIILGVCGGIASYKAAFLVRLLVKSEANVKVIMTKDATNFITPLTLATLSKNPVLIDYFKADTGEWNNHVDLALWADLLVVAPLSANTLAKLANGLCDNLLSAVYLSAKCPVYFAPAMDLDMWKHSATQQNVSKLLSFGNILIKPTHGELASGLIGEGRMEEPEKIIEFIVDGFKKKTLTGKKALVTAGPTYESIDPVRFIGNHSSGKMGYAIAKVLADLGADVTLVSGPTSLDALPEVNQIDVTSAEEMYVATKNLFNDTDIIVMCAAVADYRLQNISSEKIKKESDEIQIKLIKTIDILATLGKNKKNGQILVGFALETMDEEANAIQKLENKNLDLIVLNSLRDEGAGFKGDTNRVTIIDRQHHKEVIELKSKREVAKDICQKIVALCSFQSV